MASAKDIRGTVFQNATATFLARVEDSSGALITQANVSAVAYTVSEISKDDSAVQRAIVGHENIALSKTDVVYDTLQTDSTWTVDATGYNFRHELDVSQYEAFAEVGQVYQVRFEVTPTTGQKIVFRFHVRCI